MALDDALGTDSSARREPKTEYSLASDVAKALQETLKAPVADLGYAVAVQITFIAEHEQASAGRERQLEVSAWPLEKGGVLAHPSSVRAVVRGVGDIYKSFRVHMVMAEPEIFERQGYEIAYPF